jgi:hypothetical protein
MPGILLGVLTTDDKRHGRYYGVRDEAVSSYVIQGAVLTQGANADGSLPV